MFPSSNETTRLKNSTFLIQFVEVSKSRCGQMVEGYKCSCLVTLSSNIHLLHPLICISFFVKEALPVPNSTNFQKTSKRPLTQHPVPPPIFGKLCCAFCNEIFRVGATPFFSFTEKAQRNFSDRKTPPPPRKFSENSSSLLDQVIPYQALLNM